MADGLLVKLGSGGELLPLLEFAGFGEVGIEDDFAFLPTQRFFFSYGRRIRPCRRGVNWEREQAQQAEEQDALLHE